MRGRFGFSVVLRLTLRAGLGLFRPQARGDAIHAEQRAAAQLKCIARAGGAELGGRLELGKRCARQCQHGETESCNHFIAGRVHDFFLWFDGAASGMGNGMAHPRENRDDGHHKKPLSPLSISFQIERSPAHRFKNPHAPAQKTPPHGPENLPVAWWQQGGAIRHICDRDHILPIAPVLGFSKIAVRVVRQSPSPGYAGSPSALENGKGKAMISANLTRAAVLVSIIGLAGIFGVSPSAAQEAPADVAHVAAVSGRVVVSFRGTPSLLDAADAISDRTRLDVLANSQLQVCHYGMQRFVTMSGPARITVSAGGVTVESGKAAVISKETCAVPQASNFQGGVVTRGVSFKH
jgi:hypothetical protein